MSQKEEQDLGGGAAAVVPPVGEGLAVQGRWETKTERDVSLLTKEPCVRLFFRVAGTTRRWRTAVVFAGNAVTLEDIEAHAEAVADAMNRGVPISLSSLKGFRAETRAVPPDLRHSELCSWRFGMGAVCDCETARAQAGAVPE